MIKITLPDGAIREYEKGTTALGVAKSISEGLARKVLAAEINGQVWDATRPIGQDATLKLLTWNDTEGKNTFWHSSAHLMAEGRCLGADIRKEGGVIAEKQTGGKEAVDVAGPCVSIGPYIRRDGVDEVPFVQLVAFQERLQTQFPSERNGIAVDHPS